MKLTISLTFVLLLYTGIMHAQINKSSNIVAIQLKENGTFPNNTTLPVLLYKGVFELKQTSLASTIENVLKENAWRDSWRNGIYNFQHYHSTAHEALGVFEGWAEVQIGGENGRVVRIEKGDLVVLPAGTAHKRISSGNGFAVIGAYPDGQRWDMNYGKKEEKESAQLNIRNVALPKNDPVFGEHGKLLELWK